ncbi:hypothetical protein [Roseomonas sp. KE2513]|nr:hypothetical protein [Roseomonas sp. KE2513]
MFDTLAWFWALWLVAVVGTGAIVLMITLSPKGGDELDQLELKDAEA